jgi:hypothetical protein
MTVKKAAAIVVTLFFVIYITGCATAGAGRKNELRTTEFQNTVGAAIVIAGMGSGAYAGSQLSGSGGAGLAYGVLGGLFGGAVVGLAYWGVLYLIGDKAEAEGDQEAPKGDLNILLPKE